MANKKRKRLPTTPMLGMPRTVRSDVFLWHNHVIHTTSTGHGERGFRCRWAYKPVDYRQFVRCECGWSGLPHYRVRCLGSGKSYTQLEVAKACGYPRALIKHLERCRND
jgi:hypothetical protein